LPKLEPTGTPKQTITAEGDSTFITQGAVLPSTSEVIPALQPSEPTQETVA